MRAAQRIVAKIQCDVLGRLQADREWDLRNSGLDEVHKHIKEIRYDAESITRQMMKLEVPEDWVETVPVDPKEKHQSESVEPGPPGAAAEKGEDNLPRIADIMEPREDSPGSEEDDVDVKARFFVAVNVRSGHRKLHIWGKCGTKPGENFSAYEPHDTLTGVKFNSLCGHCWKGKQPCEVEESSTTSSSSSSSSDMD